MKKSSHEIHFLHKSLKFITGSKITDKPNRPCCVVIKVIYAPPSGTFKSLGPFQSPFQENKKKAECFKHLPVYTAVLQSKAIVNSE